MPPSLGAVVFGQNFVARTLTCDLFAIASLAFVIIGILVRDIDIGFLSV